MYLEKADEGVYRIHKRDLRVHTDNLEGHTHGPKDHINEIFDELVELHPGGFSYRIATSRHDQRLNGHSAYVKQSDNDFRKFALVLLHEQDE